MRNTEGEGCDCRGWRENKEYFDFWEDEYKEQRNEWGEYEEWMVKGEGWQQMGCCKNCYLFSITHCPFCGKELTEP